MTKPENKLDYKLTQSSTDITYLYKLLKLFLYKDFGAD